MSAQTKPVEIFDLVIVGGTGDLARRKLLPALFHRYCDGQLPAGARIIGGGRDELTDADYRAQMRDALGRHAAAHGAAAGVIEAFLAQVFYRRLDAQVRSTWEALAQMLGDRADSIRVFYLAIQPSLFSAACEQLRAAGLNGARSRLVVEKPIGHDLPSARAINEVLAATFTEQQTFRIDHYLGKETVQNLIALRFGNALFEPLWNAAHVDHVQITVAEQAGVGERHGYYDAAGAMRDMVQNHLLQLLCFVAMEPPHSIAADPVRDEKLKVLRSLQPLTGEGALAASVRGQYRPGICGTEAVPGYGEETGLNASLTETFVALRTEVNNWRWAGVPFYLRTGKRLAQRVSEIVIAFRRVPHSLFGGAGGELAPNKLIIRLQPDEGVKLSLMVKQPGPGGLRLRESSLDMTFAETFGGRHPEAYERLLMDAVRGNQTLFMRRDEVEIAWAWVDPIIAAWRESGAAPRPYAAGSWGPSAAIALVERDGRTWHEDTDLG
jgi:glucose-6-phosphate 1-dehydrogenase